MSWLLTCGAHLDVWPTGSHGRTVFSHLALGPCPSVSPLLGVTMELDSTVEKLGWDLFLGTLGCD